MLKQSTSGKLPHFFKYAKNKKTENVKPANKSTMNRLDDIIKTDKISFKTVVGHFDYSLLMKNIDILTTESKSIIEMYHKMDGKKRIEIDADDKKNKPKLAIYENIRFELLQLAEIDIVVDVLVKHLFSTKSKWKNTLWHSFGDVLVSRLEQSAKGKSGQCEDCYCRIEADKNKKLCSNCAKKRETDRLGTITRKQK
jgi:hypothetical protein